MYARVSIGFRDATTEDAQRFFNLIRSKLEDMQDIVFDGRLIVDLPEPAKPEPVPEPE